MTFHEDRILFADDKLSVTERTAQFLDRIEKRSELNAFISVLGESALQQATESDERYKSGLQRPLEGMSVTLKDNFSLVGARLTCGSRILENFEPVYDATVVERLRNAGALFVGKANMDEFAMGSSNENSAYGPVKHPLDLERVPGGSSGGSAVAVADGMCHVALGSDTGGSVRQPAAFCGIVGFKPTYGVISRYGLVAFASSLDHVSMFGRNVHDVQSVFDTIKGHDPYDSTSVADAPSQSSGKKRVGILADELISGCDASIVDAYKKFGNALRDLGYETQEITLPHMDAWIPTYFILATAEASSNLARYDGVRFGHRSEDSEADMTTASRTEGFGKEVKRRIMLGTYVLSSGYYDAYYKKAQQTRCMISDGYAAAFRDVGVIAMPTTPTTAFIRGAITDPVQMWLSDLYTVSANIAGIPAISIPFGVDEKGLPIGMQLQGAMFADNELLEVAKLVR